MGRGFGVGGFGARRGCRRLVLFAACAFALATQAAGATAPTITEFSAGLNRGSLPARGIVAGPDGNVWFGDSGSTKAIGQINPSTHAISEFSIGGSPDSGVSGIALGPDGNLWFTHPGPSSTIGEFNPSTHAITEFSNGQKPDFLPQGITLGPDGNLWFADNGSTTPAIGEIDPSTHTISEFSTPRPTNNPYGPSGLSGIALGSDGNLWFTQGYPVAIGEINPSTHAITEFSNGLNPGSSPIEITPGPDGNLWFTDPGQTAGGSTPAIGEINPSTHAISEFSAGLNPGSSPAGIAPGPDGNLWFTDPGSTKAIGEINPSTHAISEFSNGLNSGSALSGIAQGPNGSLWFTDNAPAIGQVTLSAGGGGSGGGDGSGGGGGSSQGVQLSGSPKATGNGATFALRCSAPAGQSCQTGATLTTTETLKSGQPVAISAAHNPKNPNRIVVVGRKAAMISAANTKTVTITLNPQGRKLLKRFHKLPATLTIKLTSKGQTTVAIKRKLTIKQKKKKRALLLGARLF